MDRLTVRVGKIPNAVPTKFNLDAVFRMSDKDYIGLCDVLNRLADYEETGLTPKDVQRIIQCSEAEKAGTVLILPCKMGETLWMVTQRRAKTSSPYYPFVKSTTLAYHNVERCIAEFGKTVFRTREEAYAALEKLKGANNEA